MDATAAGTYRDHRPADGAGSGRAAALARLPYRRLRARQLRRLRSAGQPRSVRCPWSGTAPTTTRPTCAGGLRTPGGAGQRLRWRTRYQARRSSCSSPWADADPITITPPSFPPTPPVAAPRSSHGIPAPMSRTILSSIPSTTCRCWSGRRRRWIRPRDRRCRGGSCPRSIRRCGVCWRRAWAGGESGNSCRCYA